MTIEDKLMVTGVREGGVNWEIGIDIYTILHIKQITNEDSLYSTILCNGLYGERILKKSGSMCMYNRSLCCTAETNTAL